MTAVILFVFGTIVGSFLNVVGLRWDLPSRGGILSNIGGRSFCPSCGKTLNWWELIPIVSFFALRARCHDCKAKISWQYPLVELWTGLVFITVPSIFILIFCLYIVITIYDFKHKIIPDTLAYASIILALILRFILGGSLLDWFTGPILFTLFGIIWLLSRGRAMGFGDAKLGLSIGLALGGASGLSAIVLAFWIGAFVSVTYLYLSHTSFLNGGKKLTMKSEVPFAPYMVLGAWISLMLHLNILNV